MLRLPHPIEHAVNALTDDPRVDRETLARKVAAIEELYRRGSPGAIRSADDLGAELRFAATLVRATADVSALRFPHPHPDVAVEFRGETVTLEVTRLRRGDRGPHDADVVFGSTGSPRLASRFADMDAERFVARQVRRKLVQARAYPAPANVLVLFSDSEMNKWALPTLRGAWRAACSAAHHGRPLPFGDFLYVSGSRMNEREERIRVNAAAETPASTSLIRAAWPLSRDFFLPGPAAADPDWPRDRVRLEMLYTARALRGRLPDGSAPRRVGTA